MLQQKEALVGGEDFVPFEFVQMLFWASSKRHLASDACMLFLLLLIMCVLAFYLSASFMCVSVFVHIGPRASTWHYCIGPGLCMVCKLYK